MIDSKHLDQTIAALPKDQQDLINLCVAGLRNAIVTLQIVAPRATIDLAMSKLMLERMAQPQDKKYANVGHGHVYPRQDGVRARCGGPKMCKDCAFDQAKRVSELTDAIEKLKTQLGYNK